MSGVSHCTAAALPWLIVPFVLPLPSAVKMSCGTRAALKLFRRGASALDDCRHELKVLLADASHEIFPRLLAVYPGDDHTPPGLLLEWFNAKSLDQLLNEGCAWGATGGRWLPGILLCMAAILCAHAQCFLLAFQPFLPNIPPSRTLPSSPGTPCCYLP